jgi:hypothetical protein
MAEQGPPEPASVWMVHKETGRDGIRGTLTLARDRLIFRPDLRGRRLDTLGETVFALDEIRSATKARLSPVLEVRTRTPGVPPVVLFYFVKPPDRYSSGFQDPRSASAFYLSNSGVLFEEEIAGWQRAIESARSR